MRDRRSIAVIVAVVTGLVLMFVPGVGWASWSAGSLSGGNGAAAATSVSKGATPAAVSTATTVTVSWAASTLASGAAVAGYRISRYDAATVTAQTVSPGCAGIVTATTCTEAGLPDGSWRYSVTPLVGSHWAGPESALSAPVLTDSTPPANAITTAVVAGGAAQTGTTIYYRGVAAGSFTLTNALTDSGSGPASSSTSALGGATTGWTHTPSTVSTPSGGPYASNPFSWIAGTTTAPTEVVTGRDALANTVASTLSFVDDSTPPTGGSISYPAGYQPDQSVTVTLTSGTDSGSGVATRALQRAGAVLTNGVCGTFAGFTVIGPDSPGSPYVDNTVANGFCYQYRYVVTDRVGNQDVITSPNVAKVDPFDGGPDLGAAGPYSVLAGVAVVNTLATTISGDVGVSPGSSITGFPPGTVAGTVNAGNPAAAAAQSDLALAYSDAAGRTPTGSFAGDQNGQTFTPGVYHTAAAFALTGTLTLDAQGDSHALFIFQIGAALNTAASSRMVLINGAQASHVYWQVLGAAGTGADSSFAGTIMASGAITLGASTELIGRALSTAATVTLTGNTIRFTTALPPVLAIDGPAALETKDVTPTITGTTNAATGSTVTVRVAGQTLTTTVTAAGTWSVTAAALTAGSQVVTASVRDGAGNAGIATQTLTIEVNPAPVDLNTAASFSVLAGTGVVGTGITAVSGDLGVSPSTAVTGFPPGTVGGTIHAGDATAAQAQADLVTANNDAAGRTPSNQFSGDQNGKTFHEGVHHTSAAFSLTGTLTLDAQGDSSAVFIIQVDAALNTAASSHVVLANGALAANVFWEVAGAAGTGASSSFVGTILAAGSITLGASTHLDGRALCTGTVTLADNVVTTT